MYPVTKNNPGFALLSREENKELARKGALVAHKRGSAHQLTTRERRIGHITDGCLAKLREPFPETLGGWITTDVAADTMGVNTRTVLKWIDRKILLHRVEGRRKFVQVKSLQLLFEQFRQDFIGAEELAQLEVKTRRGTRRLMTLEDAAGFLHVPVGRVRELLNFPLRTFNDGEEVLVYAQSVEAYKRTRDQKIKKG